MPTSWAGLVAGKITGRMGRAESELPGCRMAAECCSLTALCSPSLLLLLLPQDTSRPVDWEGLQDDLESKRAALRDKLAQKFKQDLVKQALE